MLRVFVGAECVSANQPFEVYLVALRDGGTLEALEVGVEGLESSGLVLLEEELLARDLTVRTEDEARIYSAEFSSCRGPDVYPLVRLVLLSTALTAWNFTATPIEPGVVEIEWRDPASVEGFGDTPLDGPAWFDLLFERVDSFGETSITIDEAAVCLTAITDELDWPCGWTAAGGTSASILESVRGEAQSFGTLKARFHERSAGVPRR
ncbi:MAG TPA: hypothetical protein VKA86_18455 [Candidatus Krumholzibacteria bacterium]|nr:hypothetical protein [Candidatus Krumholzibacteria bacterium]